MRAFILDHRSLYHFDIALTPKISLMHPSNPHNVFLGPYSVHKFSCACSILYFWILDAHSPHLLCYVCLFPWHICSLLYSFLLPHKKFLHIALTCFIAPWGKAKIVAQKLYKPIRTELINTILPTHDMCLIDQVLILLVIFSMNLWQSTLLSFLDVIGTPKYLNRNFPSINLVWCLIFSMIALDVPNNNNLRFLLVSN